jgi:hypothetical protein
LTSGEKNMKGNAQKTKIELEAKFASIFETRIAKLSTELREILLDDMVTALENRLNVLNRVIIKADN